MLRPAELRQRVLVVDDEEGIRSFLEVWLEAEGFEVETAPDGRTALALAERWQPAVVLLDMFLPDMEAAQFAAAYRLVAGPHAPIVMASAAYNVRSQAQAIGAAAFVEKPFDFDLICTALRCHAGQAKPSFRTTPALPSATITPLPAFAPAALSVHAVLGMSPVAA